MSRMAGSSASFKASAQDRDAAATLGLCLFLAGRKDEARNVLESLTGGEDTVADLASTLLEQM
ncbi:hypothetical protein [uncultured Mailhella sp.]|uniref:hypothetical protein n=1 Tax=uncultured Mailhella sp. TaxID=1981031 RepID=UPI0026273BFC|nr:hypothetical protein [uncultured Mailhella sp.]